MEVTTAKSQPLQSQDLAIHPEPSISQNLPKEEEIPPLDDPFESEGILIDFGRTTNSRPLQRPPSEPISHSLEEESLRKRPYSYKGRWEELEDGMSSDAMEGERKAI